MNRTCQFRGIRNKFVVSDSHLTGSLFLYGIEEHETYRIAFDQHINLSKDTGILLHYLWERSFDHDRAEGGINWVRFF